MVPELQTKQDASSFLSARKAMRFGPVVWVSVMEIFRWLCFILIHRSHPKRWAAVVPQSNYLTLAVDPWDSSAQHLVKLAVDPSLDSSAFTSTRLLPMASEVYLGWKKYFPPLTSSPSPEHVLSFNLILVHNCFISKINQRILNYGSLQS